MLRNVLPELVFALWYLDLDIIRYFLLLILCMPQFLCLLCQFNIQPAHSSMPQGKAFHLFVPFLLPLKIDRGYWGPVRPKAPYPLGRFTPRQSSFFVNQPLLWVIRMYMLDENLH